jgi:hypothetical protein
MMWLQAPRSKLRSTFMTALLVGAHLDDGAQLFAEQRAQGQLVAALGDLAGPVLGVAVVGACSPSMVRMSRLTDTPARPAKAISHSVAYRPPSERSW